MKYADLHLHTTFSDGTYTPEALIEAAAKAALSAVAIVDHDTVLAVKPCIEAATRLGIEVIPGVELTAEYEGLEIHILGYFIDYENKILLERLTALKENRIERIYKIVAKLNEIGLTLKPETVFSITAGGTVGRMHVARAMVKDGLVGNVFEAFQKYIGDKRPANVLNFKLSPEECIGLIKGAGGVSVLAHPYILNRDDLIPLFAGYGLQGLEVYYIEHDQSMINFYLRLAKKLNLVVTGGTDFHGEVKPDVRLGSIKIPYELVEKLKQAKNKA